MGREQEIIKQMLELANEYNNLPCNNMMCRDANCWSKMTLCNAVTEFVLKAEERLEKEE